MNIASSTTSDWTNFYLNFLIWRKYNFKFMKPKVNRLTF